MRFWRCADIQRATVDAIYFTYIEAGRHTEYIVRLYLTIFLENVASAICPLAHAESLRLQRNVQRDQLVILVASLAPNLASGDAVSVIAMVS